VLGVGIRRVHTARAVIAAHVHVGLEGDSHDAHLVLAKAVAQGDQRVADVQLEAVGHALLDGDFALAFDRVATLAQPQRLERDLAQRLGGGVNLAGLDGFLAGHAPFEFVDGLAFDRGDARLQAQQLEHRAVVDARAARRLDEEVHHRHFIGDEVFFELVADELAHGRHGDDAQHTHKNAQRNHCSPEFACGDVPKNLQVTRSEHVVKP